MNTADLFDRWVARLRRQQPDALAILCHGSYARDAAEAHSDLDLDILLPSEPPIAYRSAFEELADGRLLHATIQMLALTEWLADRAE
ncbi:MAG TPA: nucleotidyltransferase domain-containing protein, partial [Roseiflexaceae bacterium]|nr:nucleotidyltransferase domain-containing protein [Roseiflexaceae bacterium]